MNLRVFGLYRLIRIFRACRVSGVFSTAHGIYGATKDKTHLVHAHEHADLLVAEGVRHLLRCPGRKMPKGPLSALQAYTKAPWKIDFLWRMLHVWPLKRPRRARTGEAARQVSLLLQPVVPAEGVRGLWVLETFI
jgi:hypothetical protein